MPRPLTPGDRVLLIDTKHRRHLITLAEGGAFHSHAGVLDHAQLIGEDEGITVRTTMNARMVAVRPTLAEYILKMPRGAQVIYPKDLGPILMLADIFPGARVLESGVGFGRADDDAAARDRARRATSSATSCATTSPTGPAATSKGSSVPTSRSTIEVRDVYDGIDVTDLDRVMLDLPEPWRVVKHAEAALRPGGILLSYLPTIGQVMQLREELAESAFGMAESLEVLQRGWNVDGQSVRPDHRMVGHTGFLTHARLLAATP